MATYERKWKVPCCVDDCQFPASIELHICSLHRAAPALLSLLKRLNYTFYVDGTSKALKPVMAETRALIEQVEKGDR